MFRDFCGTIGVANIRYCYNSVIHTRVHVPNEIRQHCNNNVYWSYRQYEEKQLKGQQAREEKRLEFTNLEQRLQNQLEFERQKNPAGV